MKAAYQTLLQDGKLTADDAQRNAVDVLATLASQLNQQVVKHGKKTLINWLPSTPDIKGIYFHGPVGRGKTMLMDLFYQHLLIEKKTRLHFHRFMAEIHQQLHALPKMPDPLQCIAKNWASKIRVLCFDEFFISDIGDAMLIAGLLNAFFQQGIILITTSNCHPQALYRNGLQRERFLPTIALLNQYCQIVAVDGNKDHRLALFAQQGQYRNYFFPLPDAVQKLAAIYTQLTERAVDEAILNINGRAITAVASHDDTIWFDFFALCSGPRSQMDYIAIANQFNTVLLSNVPQFCGERVVQTAMGVEDGYRRQGEWLADIRQLDDEARRFIALVDEFYDASIRLIISAQVDIVMLYQGEQLSFEFARCQSRLFEMQNRAC